MITNKHKEKVVVVNELKCWSTTCSAIPPITISGGNRYRWMYLHMADHFKKGELVITTGVDVKREIAYCLEALELSNDAIKELSTKLAFSDGR